VIITGSGTAFMNNSTKQAASSFNTQTSEFIRRRSNELFGPLLYMLPNGQLISDSKGEEKAHQRAGYTTQERNPAPSHQRGKSL
jgi:hypothetical protein